MKRLPCVAPPLTAPIQPFEQNAAGFVAVAVQAFGVAYGAIVIPVVCVLSGKRSHQLAQRPVPLSFYPFGKPSHRPPQLLAAGATLHVGLPATASSPGELKSQEVEPPVVASMALHR